MSIQNDLVKKVPKFAYDGIEYDTEDEAYVAVILKKLGIRPEDRPEVAERLRANARDIAGACSKLCGPATRSA